MRFSLTHALILTLTACGGGFTAAADPSPRDDAGPPDAASDAPPDALGHVDAPSEGASADGPESDAGDPLDASPDIAHPPDAPPDAPQPPPDSGAEGGCTLVTHDDGFGEHWQDCNPLGTYTFATGMTACATRTGSMSYCAALGGGGAQWTVCSNAGGYPQCYCWQWGGGQQFSVGYVNHGQYGCELPGSGLGTDTAWQ